MKIFWIIFLLLLAWLSDSILNVYTLDTLPTIAYVVVWFCMIGCWVNILKYFKIIPENKNKT